MYILLTVLPLLKPYKFLPLSLFKLHVYNKHNPYRQLITSLFKKICEYFFFFHESNCKLEYLIPLLFALGIYIKYSNCENHGEIHLMVMQTLHHILRLFVHPRTLQESAEPLNLSSNMLC